MSRKKGAGKNLRLRAFRVLRDLSQKELADLCGRSQQWLSKIEQGQEATKLEESILARALDVEPERIFGGRDG